MQQVITRRETVQIMARNAMRGDHASLVMFRQMTDPNRDAKRVAAVEAYRSRVEGSR